MYQGMTYLEIAQLFGMAVITVICVWLVLIVGRLLVLSFMDAILDSVLMRKLLGSEKLIVSHKRHIAPHEIIGRRKLLTWNRDTPVGYLICTIPPQDMWIVLVDIPFGPFSYNDLAFAVDQSTWLELAPGDEMDNPHFGGFRPEVVVDMDIQRWLVRTAEV